MELAAQALVHESCTITVPGLLQTPDFARASLRSGAPHATEQEIEDKLTARLNRQRRVHGDAPARYWFILDEAALRRPVGSPSTTVTQLAALLDGGDCIEVDDANPGRVRDSKDPAGPVLTFAPAALHAFVRATATGEFGEA